jgi:transposase
VGTTAARSVGKEGDASVRTRRRWPAQEKLRIVLETLAPGVSVPVVARRHGVNANQLFIWRGQYRRGELAADEQKADAVQLLPVRVEQPTAPESSVGGLSESGAHPAGCLEIQFFGARHVKVWGSIDPKSLRALIRELLRPC